MASNHAIRQSGLNLPSRTFVALLAAVLASCATLDGNETEIRVLENPRVGVQKLSADKSGAAVVKEEWQFVLCQGCKNTKSSGKMVWLMVSTNKKWEPVEEDAAESVPDAAGKAVKRFAFDSAKINGDVSELESMLFKLKADPTARVKITGFTDSVGNAKYNLMLSKKRAQAVANWFVKQGVARSRMTIEGKGEQSPVSENATVEGMAANRRSETTVSVEVITP